MSPAALTRLRRAATLAQATLDRFARGQTGKNLRQYLITHGPADVWDDAEGHHCRCYGLQPPPARSAAAAITAWAQMALQHERTLT